LIEIGSGRPGLGIGNQWGRWKDEDKK
jgi:hypothetical protein